MMKVLAGLFLPCEILGFRASTHAFGGSGHNLARHTELMKIGYTMMISKFAFNQVNHFPHKEIRCGLTAHISPWK